MTNKYELTIVGDKLIIEGVDQPRREISIYTLEGFEILSSLWIKSGWHHRYSYTFSWLGIPIIQFPEDIVRIQEIIHNLRPDVIIETGIAHGGSLIFYASLCKVMGKGRVIGIDIEIRPQNRRAIEAHPLFPLITLIEGNSVAQVTVSQVEAFIRPSDSVLILLDSNHSKSHVLNELHTYAPLVSVGSYIVATDGIMEVLADTPSGSHDWSWDNPQQAALEFVRENPAFVIEEPDFMFSESQITERITYWPKAFIKRLY